ncbi:hypothetical protein [Galbibacter sp.]|uniref:hypothetical protein n=1 Tax=Galbibacter sp. TaxID=2918471 RepID=UPI003A95921D
MRNNLIMTIIVLITYVVVIGILSLYYYKKNNGEKLWIRMGFNVGFWQGVVLASMGFTTLTLIVFKWTNFISF